MERSLKNDSVKFMGIKVRMDNSLFDERGRVAGGRITNGRLANAMRNIFHRRGTV